jgi:hypothetical protein
VLAGQSYMQLHVAPIRNKRVATVTAFFHSFCTENAFQVLNLTSLVGGSDLREMAGATGLEPATSCVTGRRSNQLNYAPAKTTIDDFHVLRRPSGTCTALRVTGQRCKVLQLLTRHAGTAKRCASHTRHRILWVGLWVEKKAPHW